MNGAGVSSVALLCLLPGMLAAQDKPPFKSDAACQQALRANKPLRAFTEGDLDIQNHVVYVQPLVSIYSGAKFTVYVEEYNLVRMAGFDITNGSITDRGVWPGYEGRLYFVFHDETTRKQAISAIKNCDRHLCAGADNADLLKYVMLEVFYSRTARTMQIRKSQYIAPVECTIVGQPSTNSKINEFREKFLMPDSDTVLSTYAPYNAVVGEENLTFKPWSVLLGDTRTLETSPGVLKITGTGTPLLFEVFESTAREAANEHATQEHLNSILARQRAAIPTPQQPLPIPPHKPGPAYSDRDFLVRDRSELWNGQRRLGLNIKGRGRVLGIYNYNAVTHTGMPIVAIAGQREQQPIVCTMGVGLEFPSGLKIGDSVLVEGSNYDKDTPLAATERQELASSERVGGPDIPHFKCTLRNLSDPTLHGITRSQWDPVCFNPSSAKPDSRLNEYCRSTSTD